MGGRHKESDRQGVRGHVRILVSDAEEIAGAMREQVDSYLAEIKRANNLPIHGPRIVKRFDDLWEFATTCGAVCTLENGIDSVQDLIERVDVTTQHGVLFSVAGASTASSAVRLRFGYVYARYLKYLHHQTQIGMPLDSASAKLGVRLASVAAPHAKPNNIQVLFPGPTSIPRRFTVQFREIIFTFGVLEAEMDGLLQQRLVVEVSARLVA